MTPRKQRQASSAAERELRKQAQLLAQGRHPDPAGFLGRHLSPQGVSVRVFAPRMRSVSIADGPTLDRLAGTDLFICSGDPASVPVHYRILRSDEHGLTHSAHDPYSFPPMIDGFDRQVFGEGHHWHAYRFLGANPRSLDGISGTLFAVWAPRAQRLSVVGDFNQWDGRCHPMRAHPGGIWELFIPEMPAGSLYKFEIRAPDGSVFLKSDPYARQFQLRPETASVLPPPSDHSWSDGEWIEARRARDWLHAPMSVYEVHLGSWKRHPDGRPWSYRELADELPRYVRDLGFTHLELMPISEYPFDGSWGYQTIGIFAATSRYGTPDDFRHFVDECHRQGIGVLLDWVPAHFPRDAHGLARFDGLPLYEHADPRRGEHPDWNTLIYDYGRPEVRNYLLASALYWLEEFHIDGLRVDAVASMLYLDYSRKPGEWLPNRQGGNQNLEAVEFVRELNAVVHDRFPGALVIAEESTAWPQVSRPAYLGGLGFSMKWDLGWMHDTLDYFRVDPLYRRYHQDRLTFSMLYRYAENYVLSLSHDEVVHGKRSLLEKMPGDRWQRFANLRLLYTYLMSFAGKKLLFMGQEFAQAREWNHDRELDWGLLQDPLHRGVQTALRELNRLYRQLPALHRLDFEPGGFEWIDCNDAAQSVLSYLRRSGDDIVVVVLNFTPVVRESYRVGVPVGGIYRELFNSDSRLNGGSDVVNPGELRAEAEPRMGRPCSLSLRLPPLGGIILAPLNR
ncbi:MAG: 1,4-alpha-glucan branching protein GlgB [Arenimonas sp.]|jgi:1,4-alpha-glucan branching enzyme